MKLTCPFPSTAQLCATCTTLLIIRETLIISDDDEEGPALIEGDDDDEEEDGDGKGEGKDKDAEVKKEKDEKEEETPMEQLAEEDEVDPLDAYMEEVKQEVKKFNIGPMKGNDRVGASLLKETDGFVSTRLTNFAQQKGAATLTKVVTVVKTKKLPLMHKKKGELMENDQDAMEVCL